MASEKQHNTAPEATSSNKSCFYGGTTDNSVVKNRTSTAVKRAVRCADCGKKFGDWRLLQRHKRKTCPNSSLRFSCRECKAYFSAKSELDSHISAAHMKKEHRSKNSASMKSSQKKIKSGSSSVSKKCTADRSSKWKEVQKGQKKSEKLKIKRSRLARRMAKRAGKLKARMRDGKKSEECDKPVVETCTVGSNPFPFTTSCAPDAQSFQFLCQSCLTCRFATYSELRQHEDWCARVPPSQGFVCLPCGRHYRNQGTLHRHADEHHYTPVSSEVKKTLVNPYLFTTTIAQDAASHPYVCSSCQFVCFISLAQLRRHEDWCGQCSSAKDGFKCNTCGRYFRTAVLLGRHTDAAGCEKADTVGTVGDSIVIDDDTEVTSLESDVQQKTEAITHGVCPLCDVPYASQYEQKFHFLNVHNLTSSDLNIKEAFERYSRRTLAGTQVTCLDCDRKVSSRLELVQHKRVCTKEKEARRIILPIATLVSTSVKDKSTSKGVTVKNKKPSSKNVDASKRSTATTVNSTSHKTPASSENQQECGISKLSGSRALDSTGTQRLEVTRSLLLNTTKVRKLIGSTGAKMLLKPDGELIVLCNGGQKSSTTNGTITGVCKDTEIQSTSEKKHLEQEKSCSSQEPSAISYDTVDSDLLIESPDSLQSSDRTNDCIPEDKANKQIISEDPKPTTESLELLSCEENPEQTKNGIQARTHEVNHNDDQQHLQTVADRKSTEAKNASKAAVKSCSVAVKPLKLTRKRSWKNEVIDVVDPDLRNRSTSVHVDEIRNGKKSSTIEEQSLVRNTRSRRSQNSAVQATDVPAPASISEAKISHLESSSDVIPDDVQQILLEALQLVPKSRQKLLRASTTQYRTRSVAHTHATGNEDSGITSKKSRADSKHGGELSKSAVSSNRKGHQLLATGNKKETVEVNTPERTHIGTGSVSQTTHINASKQEKPSCSEKTVSMPQTTWTVEPSGSGLVRCVACKMVFRTVQQITDHVCAGH